MPAERFYIDAELSDTVVLEGTEFHHLAHVMRVEKGETVELVNGRCSIAKAKVEALSKHSATLQILSSEQFPPPPTKLTLAIPLMRPAKLELIVEKCTELGADAYLLYPAQYSDKDALSPHQLERLQTISISAMKQCGRLDLPSIQILSRFEDLFKTGPLFFGDTRPGAEQKFQAQEGVFITGPEKGFSEKELQLLDQKATAISLHKNILRAETAPIVAIIKMSCLR